jgi:hypothetical protein
MLTVAVFNPVFAQTPTADASAKFETRAELEAQAKAAESQHRQSEAWLLRSRLEKGDFQEGDRIVVSLRMNSAAPPETLSVREGRILQVPPMADLSLEGVLRSELTDRMRKHFAQYLKDPEVRATPLLRVGVLGSVGRQGYYYASADLLLTDVLMRAGGPASDADLNKITIRRGTDVIWSPSDTRTALNDGLSLDRLHLRAGDELYVGKRRNFPWLTVITVALSAITLGLSLRNY